MPIEMRKVQSQTIFKVACTYIGIDNKTWQMSWILVVYTLCIYSKPTTTPIQLACLWFCNGYDTNAVLSTHLNKQVFRLHTTQTDILSINI